MIYFDNNATTQIAPEVFEAMKPFLTEFYGNPSSAYNFGRETRKAIEESRENVADLIGAKNSNEIVFTSGGTESDNWAIHRSARSKSRQKTYYYNTSRTRSRSQILRKTGNKRF